VRDMYLVYCYDPVGNRTQKTSTLPGYPGTSSSYNADDQLATDTVRLREPHRASGFELRPTHVNYPQTGHLSDVCRVTLGPCQL
jgi:hypothetical protein